MCNLTKVSEHFDRSEGFQHTMLLCVVCKLCERQARMLTLRHVWKLLKTANYSCVWLRRVRGWFPENSIKVFFLHRGVFVSVYLFHSGSGYQVKSDHYSTFTMAQTTASPGMLLNVASS